MLSLSWSPLQPLSAALSLEKRRSSRACKISAAVLQHGRAELREAFFACCSLCHFPVCTVHDAKIRAGMGWTVRATSSAASSAASSASASWLFRGLCLPSCHLLAARAPERIISEPYLQGLQKGISRGPRGYVKKNLKDSCRDG